MGPPTPTEKVQAPLPLRKSICPSPMPPAPMPEPKPPKPLQAGREAAGDALFVCRLKRLPAPAALLPPPPIPPPPPTASAPDAEVECVRIRSLGNVGSASSGLHVPTFSHELIRLETYGGAPRPRLSRGLPHADMPPRVLLPARALL
mmetsp:Transcript_10621/g.29376  ORF Transcript_10621/g.29376 Transcript_10621/m.29376 type:complete len:147 (-) Transcript_10621:376-816(-)